MEGSKPLFSKTKIQTDFAKLNKIIYGWPKSGKTTLAAQQTDHEGRQPLFIATEDGHHAIECYAERVSGWDGFKKMVKFITDNEAQIKREHSCLIVDLVSDLDQMCAEFVCKQNNVRHQADMEFGKGFALVKQEFQAAVRPLFNVLPMTFICHSVDRELTWNNEKVKVQSPSLSKGTLEYINGKVDCIMWMLPANSKQEWPKVTMRNTTTSIAGSRYKQLARDFTFYPNEPARTYSEIQKVFAGETTAPVEQMNVSTKEVAAATVAG